MRREKGEIQRAAECYILDQYRSRERRRRRREGEEGASPKDAEQYGNNQEYVNSDWSGRRETHEERNTVLSKQLSTRQPSTSNERVKARVALLTLSVDLEPLQSGYSYSCSLLCSPSDKWRLVDYNWCNRWARLPRRRRLGKFFSIRSSGVLTLSERRVSGPA